jgi:hypothetical protein
MIASKSTENFFKVESVKHTPAPSVEGPAVRNPIGQPPQNPP